MPATPPSGRTCALALAAALAGAGLAGCQALGGGGGVMPATDVGLPPSLRGSIPGREARTATVDQEGRPLQTAPTRQLALPKSAGAGSRTAEAGERRIRREDIEGNEVRSSSGGSMSPTMSSGGGVGLGGKF
ncbi:hypothetical protein Q8W71_23980 [Methylobacterium sp. NEAU 140]|uniref:hypothetical protein n=1 Tax=Methylobacterium sp. NEAU 140 TaxID=3064945 RepID=UPI0027345C6C|nr:hypothetical protein [Methylobacterium sp. NEAU 140]MDP4025698.1 hypothetical protein [Methylobacterium sp. NEAU 140]